MIGSRFLFVASLSLIILIMTQTALSSAVSMDEHPVLENVTVISTRDYLVVLADNGCNQVYTTAPNNTLNPRFWSSLARSGSGETVYYRGSLGEYLDLMETIDGILEKTLPGEYRDLRTLGYRPENETSYHRTGLIVYVNPGYADNATVEAIKEAIGPIMVEHNLTKLVVFEALSNASVREVYDMGYLVATLPQKAYENGEDMPGYLREAVELTLEEGYIGYGVWPGVERGYVGMGFREPLPPPTLGDLEEIAWWLLNHTSKCGVPIVLSQILSWKARVPKAAVGGGATGSSTPTGQQNNTIFTPTNMDASLTDGVQAKDNTGRTSSQDTRDEPILAIVVLASSIAIGSGFLFLGSRLWRPYQGS